MKPRLSRHSLVDIFCKIEKTIDYEYRTVTLIFSILIGAFKKIFNEHKNTVNSLSKTPADTLKGPDGTVLVTAHWVFNGSP
jgi:hypothetical protein